MVLSTADLLLLALTVFTFQNNTKIAVNIHSLEIFALLLVFSNQSTAKCLSLLLPLVGGAISKPLTLPFALAFRTINIETLMIIQALRVNFFHLLNFFKLILTLELLAHLFSCNSSCFEFDFSVFWPLPKYK